MAAPTANTKLTRPGHNIFTQRAMRTSGPQAFDTENFNAGQIINVQKNIPLLQPLAHIIYRWRGRLGVTVAITDLPQEAPFTVLRQIKIFGTHTSLGTIVPFQASGEMLNGLDNVFDRGKDTVSYCNITVGGVTTYYNAQSLVKGLGAAFPIVGNYDIEVFWMLPVYPFGANDFNALQYLWDARSWNQSLQQQITCGDVTAFGTTGTRTLTAYGSASGVPSIDILLDYANLGPQLDASIAKAIVQRNDYFVSNSLVNAGNAVRLNLLQNAKTTNVLVKTGVLQAGSSNIYATLSDSIIEQAILRVNQSPIRNLQYDDVTDFFYAWRNGRFKKPGYLLLSLDDGEPSTNPHAALRANEYSGSTQFDVAANIIGPSATNLGEVMQEIILGEPVIATAQPAAAA